MTSQATAPDSHPAAAGLQGFRPFDGTPARDGPPYLSIWPSGYLYLSDAAVKDFDLRRFAWARFYWSESDRRIGLRFSNSPRPPAGMQPLTRRYKLCWGSRKNPLAGPRVCVRSLLTHLGVTFSRVVHANVVWDEGTQFLVGRLPKGSGP